jgi:hypothetical protein
MRGAARGITLLAFAFVFPLTILACGGGTVTPTAPTVMAPPVAEPAPPSEPAAPPPPPSAPGEDPAITVRGTINRMSRSGAGGIDVYFRIDDQPWVRGDAATVVIDGSFALTTTALRERQTVTIDGRQRADHVYAKRVVIETKP